MSPNMADSGENDILLHKNLKKYRESIKKQPVKFNLGDKVRVKIEKSIFTKGYKQSSSDSIFEIIQINTKHPIPLYKIKNISTQENIEGQFYGTELQRVRL